MKHTLCYVLLICTLARVASAATEFWVSPNGSDANPGTREQPLASIAAARDAVRKAHAGGATVWLRGGAYPLTATIELTSADSGTVDAPIVYRAAPGEEVRLTGGRTLDPSHFQPVKDPAILSRIPSEAVGHVMQLDLKSEGIADLGALESRGWGRTMAPVQAELIFNDRPMRLARWPNNELTHYGDVVDPGSAPRLRGADLPAAERKDEPDRPGRFKYLSDRPARWITAEDLWLLGYWKYGWADDTLQVASIDTAKHEIALAAPAFYGVAANNRFCAINLLEELDSPGEYYIDRRNNVLYFWPPAALEKARATITQLRDPLLALKQSSRVTFRDLCFEDCRGSAISLVGGTGVRFIGCTIRNAGNRGVIFGDETVDGGHDNGLDGCHIADTGAEGIVLSGGDRKTLTAGNNFITNSDIHDVARWYRQSRPAIAMYGVGNRAANNFIHDCVASGVMFWGNDALIEQNDIARCCTDSDDAGALYTGRNPSARGNRIRHNLIRDIGPPSPGQTGVFSVYIDDGSSGQIVESNIFFHGGKASSSVATVFMHGGYDNVIENNVLIDSPGTVTTAAWTPQAWKEFVNGVVGVQRLRDEVDITKPPYSTRYPQLATVFADPPPAPRVNVDRNNQTMTATPALLEAMRDDVRRSERIELLRALPACKDIPVNRIGRLDR
jgi:hypothetical protein